MSRKGAGRADSPSVRDLALVAWRLFRRFVHGRPAANGYGELSQTLSPENQHGPDDPGPADVLLEAGNRVKRGQY